MTEQSGQGTPVGPRTKRPQADTGSRQATSAVLCFAAVLIICVFFRTTQLGSNLSVLFMVAVALVVTATIVLLKNYSTLARGFWLTLAVAGASVGADAIVASQRGTTLIKALTALVNEVQQILLSAYGSMADETIREALDQATRMSLKILPLLYIVSAAVVVVLSFAVCSFISKRMGTDLNVAPVSSLDFSPHVLWIPIAGLLAYSASFLWGEYKEVLVVIAINIALVSRLVFVVQATGVYGFFAEKVQGWGFVKIFLYLVFLGLETVFFTMSVIGLLDFWRNFRRLPREKAHEEVPEPSV